MSFEKEDTSHSLTDQIQFNREARVKMAERQLVLMNQERCQVLKRLRRTLFIELKTSSGLYKIRL